MAQLTIKQQKLIKEIPNCKTLKEAAEKAGYKEGNKSRWIYKETTRKHIRDAIASDPEAIKKAYEDLLLRCKASNDLSTERATLQDLARINAMMTDKTQNKTEISQKDADLLDKYTKNRLSGIL